MSQHQNADHSVMSDSLSFDVRCDLFRNETCCSALQILPDTTESFVYDCEHLWFDAPSPPQRGQEENGNSSSPAAASCARLISRWLQEGIQRNNAARHLTQPLGEAKGCFFAASADVAQVGIRAISGFRHLRDGHFVGFGPAEHWMFGHSLYFSQKCGKSTGNISGRNQRPYQGILTMRHDRTA